MLKYQKAKTRITIISIVLVILFLLSLMWLSAVKAKTKNNNTTTVIPQFTVGGHKIQLDITDNSINVEPLTEGMNNTIAFTDMSRDKAVISFLTDATNMASFNSEIDNTIDIGYNIRLNTKHYGNSEFYYITVNITDNFVYVISGLNITTIENIMCGVDLYIDGNKYNYGTDILELLNNIETNTQETKNTKDNVTEPVDQNQLDETETKEETTETDSVVPTSTLTVTDTNYFVVNNDALEFVEVNDSFSEDLSSIFSSVFSYDGTATNKNVYSLNGTSLYVYTYYIPAKNSIELYNALTTKNSEVLKTEDVEVIFSTENSVFITVTYNDTTFGIFTDKTSNGTACYLAFELSETPEAITTYLKDIQYQQKQ